MRPAPPGRSAGCRFYAGYPITPSSEIAEEMARRLPAAGGVFVQMEDEIASLAAVIGASLGGLRAMTATSGPGFSLMQEHIGFAAMAEVPCVIINVMRGGPSTGLPTSPAQGDVMQARWGTHDEVLAHMREEVVLPEPPPGGVLGRRRPAVPPPAYRPYAPDPDGVPPLADFGSGYRFHVTGLAHDEGGFPTQDPATIAAHQRRRLAKVALFREIISPVDTWRLEDAEVAVVAYGIVARAAQEAIEEARARGLRVGLLRPAVLWPFPDREVAEAARAVRAVVVAEMNLGQVVREVERAVAGAAPVIPCCRADGHPITPEEILEAVAAREPAGRTASYG